MHDHVLLDWDLVILNYLIFCVYLNYLKHIWAIKLIFLTEWNITNVRTLLSTEDSSM